VLGLLKLVKEYIAKYSVIILFVLIAAVIVTLFVMRARNISLKNQVQTEKDEKNRYISNIDAANDTIKVTRDKNGVLVSEISGYKLKVSELNTNYKNLFTLYTQEKNKKPVYIIEYSTSIIQQSNGATSADDTIISFVDTATYSLGNYKNITGTIPYKLTYHIKKNMLSRFSLEQALYKAFTLEQNGVKDASVVAIKDNKIIPIKEAQNDNSVFYKVLIYESRTKIDNTSVGSICNVDPKTITMYYDGTTFRYTVGDMVTYKEAEPIIDNSYMNTYAKLNVYPAKINFSQGMVVQTGLYKDKNGKVMIYAKSNYPGLEFTNLVGADIMQDPVSRKVARSFRKEFGIGLHLGYGVAMVKSDVSNEFIMKTGPVISVGLNWSPKFLQFGPSKK
jgi:hypothetical protein